MIIAPEFHQESAISLKKFEIKLSKRVGKMSDFAMVIRLQHSYPHKF